MITLLASSFMGAAAFLGAIFGAHTDFAQHLISSTTPTERHEERHGSTTPEKGRMASSTPMGVGMPAVVGKVTGVDGMMLTVIGRGPKSTATTTYSVDATNAKVLKREVGTTTVASIKTGDMVFVTGTVSDTSVIAKLILDGIGPIRQIIEKHEGMDKKGMENMKMGSSTSMRMHAEEGATARVHTEGSTTLPTLHTEKPRLPGTR